jgi:hypothetical protein
MKGNTKSQVTKLGHNIYIAEDLKPCPFCGTKARIYRGKIKFRNNRARKTKHVAYSIGCSGQNCILYGNGAQGALFFTPSKYGLEKMVERWNRRASKKFFGQPMEDLMYGVMDGQELGHRNSG